MIVDYQAIANDDLGGDLNAAFNQLKSLTVDEIVDVRINDIGLAARIGLTKTMAFLTALKAGVSGGVLPQEIVDWFASEKGIELNNVESIATLDSLVVAGILDAALRDEIVALRVNTKLKYPRLKLGHLQNAREKQANTYGVRN